MTTSRRRLANGLAAMAALAGGRRSQAQEAGPVQIEAPGDLSPACADLSGPALIEAVRTDGRTVRDIRLAEVRAPQDSKETWDQCRIVKTLTGGEAFRSMAARGCRLGG